MALRSVLVVGAGIAGSTLAYLLAKRGIAVTVVEHSAAQRSSGNPVDVRGPALPVVEQMGLLEPIRAAATQVRRLTVVDSHGRPIGWVPTQAGPDGIEIPRARLASILAEAGREMAEFVYGDTVVALREAAGGVEATFATSAARVFDLAVGADGLHSTVRRLVVGPEDRFVTHLGMFIATVGLDRMSPDPYAVLMHNLPGRAVAVHPTTGREGGFFIFRRGPLAPGEGADLTSQKQIVSAAFRGVAWRVPELLDRVRDCDDFYFDSVSRVRLSRWFSGRVVLIGDAADCISVFGEGSSMAIAGAATLAEQLATDPTDLSAALRRYEHVHRKRLRPHHRAAPIAGQILVPSTSSALALRNGAFRAYATASTIRDRIQRRVVS